MTTMGYPAHAGADLVTSLTTIMFELRDSLFTSSRNNALHFRHNGNDDGSTVRTRPLTVSTSRIAVWSPGHASTTMYHLS